MRAGVAALVSFLLCSIGTTAQAATVHFDFVDSAGKPAAELRTLTLTRVEPPPARVKTIVIASGHAIFSDDAGSSWTPSLRDASWWTPAEAIVLPADRKTERRSLKVWRMGIVRGRIVVSDPKLKPPDTVRLMVEAPPFTLGVPDIARGTTFDCVIDKQQWSCRVPAARLDVTLRASGFAPVYLADVTAKEQTPYNAGVVTVRRGGSVVVWLDKRFVGEGDHVARAQLNHMVPPELTVANVRLSVPVAASTFSKTGVVRLEGVPAGQYDLSVTAPGYAVTRISGVRVFEGKTSSLQKVLELERPLTLTLALDPPYEMPGVPWTVELRRERTYSSGFERDNRSTRRTGADGQISWTDQSPGMFTIVVSDSRHNTAAYQVAEVRNALDAFVKVPVKRYAIKGHLTMASRPLRGTIWFGGRHGAARVQVAVDERGAFSGTLPRLGRWRADVQSADGLLNFEKAVSIKADEDVDLALPVGSVRGRVVDKDSNPVADAEVTVRSGTAGSIRTSTDLRGEFVAATVPEGKATMWSRDPRTGATSARIELVLIDGEERSGIELRMLERAAFSGIVISDGQPVAGARVSGFAVGAPQVFQSVATTDANGKFEFLLTEGATGAHLVVAAGVHSLRTFMVSTAQQPVMLAIDRAGGSVKLHMNTEGWRLEQNGIRIPTADLVMWIQGHAVRIHNDPLLMPDMAGGTYRACTAGPKPKCAEAVLAPGGEIDLNIMEETRNEKSP